MKIISKEKDFYDYLIPYDEDDDLIYIRKPNIIYNTDLPKGFTFKHPISISQSYYFSSDQYKYAYSLEVINITFGIYPYVYNQAFLYLYKKLEGIRNILPAGQNIVPISKDLLEKYTNEEIINHFVKYSKTELNLNTINTYCNLHINKEHKTHYKWWQKYNKDKKTVEENPTKNEEIFTILKSPVFVYIPIDYNNEKYVGESLIRLYEGNIPKRNGFVFITNISFNRIANAGINLVKYFLNDILSRNVYTDIENFLWSIKQEPEANPDNKTRIINAGFDLKTSFRNM